MLDGIRDGIVNTAREKIPWIAAEWMKAGYLGCA
jgi:hypothetical protein